MFADLNRLNTHFFYDQMITDAGDTHVLSTKETHHAMTVRRIKHHESIYVVDGLGNWIYGVAKKVKKELVITIVKRGQDKPATPHISVIQGMPKSKQVESMVEMLTELQVNEIVPWKSDFSQIKIDVASQKKMLARWKKISVEAMKQSRQSFIPRFASLCDGDDVYTALQEYDIVILLDLNAPLRITDELYDESYTGRIAIVVGPEGDFSDAEYSKLDECGVLRRSLTKSVLRSSLAAAVAVASLRT